MAKSQSLKLLNRNEEAIAELDVVIKYHRSNGAPFLDDFLRTQARWLGERGKWEAALKCQLEAIQINEIDDIPQWLAFSLVESARCHMQLGNFESARDELIRAKELYKVSRSVTEVGECDLNLARCYFRMRAFEVGLECATRAEDIARSSRNSPGQARAYLVMVQINIAQLDLEKAAHNLDGVDALANTTWQKDWDLLLEVQEVTALFHRTAKSLDLAKEYERRAATIREILG